MLHSGTPADRRRDSPPAYGAHQEQDSLVDAPCPDLAFPRPTVRFERTAPKKLGRRASRNHRLGSTFARIFDRPIHPKKGTKGRRTDGRESGPRDKKRHFPIMCMVAPAASPAVFMHARSCLGKINHNPIELPASSADVMPPDVWRRRGSWECLRLRFQISTGPNTIRIVRRKKSLRA